MNWRGPDAHQEKLIWKAASVFALLFLVSVGLGIGWCVVELLKEIQNVVIPVTIAVILSYLLNPIIEGLEKLGLKRMYAVALLFVVAAGLIALLVIFLGPQLYVQTHFLVESIPGWFASIRDKTSSILRAASDGPMGNLGQIANAHLHDATKGMIDTAWSKATGVLQTVGFLFGMVFTPFYLFYFLVDQPRISHSWKNFIPGRKSGLQKELIVVVEQINKYMVAFFRGQIIVAATDGALIAIGLSCIGVQYGLLIGAAACVLTIIPYFGIMTVCLLTFLVAGNQTGGGTQLIFLSMGLFAAVQTIENTLISPRVMGKKTGLHPVVVILSILIWSTLLGTLLGAILAVPLTATLKVLMNRYALLRTDDSDTKAAA